MLQVKKENLFTDSSLTLVLQHPRRPKYRTNNVPEAIQKHMTRRFRRLLARALHRDVIATFNGRSLAAVTETRRATYSHSTNHQNVHRERNMTSIG